jgi:hypothetical protein
MRRYSIAGVSVAAVLLACALLPIGSLRAQGAEKVTTIAILITVPEDQPMTPAAAMMKEMMAHIAKQAGLIDQTLLASSFPGNKPSHVHISRWQSLSDWESLNESAEFLALVERTGRYIDLQSAEVFQPVP